MLTKVFARLTLCLCLAALANATTYNCTISTVPGAPVTNNGIANAPSGVNVSGDIVGAYSNGGPQHEFIQNVMSGSFTTVDYPGASSTQLFTINNSGTAVGMYQTSSGSTGAFTRDASGAFKAVALPSPYNNDTFSVYGINDHGDISGFVVTAPGESFFILNADGTINLVPQVIVMGDNPGSLNLSGQLLEEGGLGQTQLRQPDNSVTQIEFMYPPRNPPNPPTQAFGLNNAGAIVGYSAMGLQSSFELPWVGFVRDPSGVYSEFVCPGVPYFSNPTGPIPRGINDNGQVVGGIALVGNFFATPLPGAAQVSLSTRSITFPPAPVGQTSAPTNVTVTNTGNARLDIAAVHIMGINSGDFKVSGCLDPTTHTTSLNPGASCTLSVTATPSASGQRTGSVVIDSSAPTAPDAIPVSVTGAATAPSCQISSIIAGPPAQVNFTMQDTNSGLKTITLLDATNANANIPPFTQGTTSPVMVSATQVDGSQSSKVDFQVTNGAGGATTCGATFGGSVQWTGLGGTVNSKIAVARNTDGRLQAFVRGNDNALWTIAQAAPDNGWASWVSLGGVLASDPVVGVNQNGSLQVFVIGGDSAVWTNAQSSPGGSFSGWQSLAGGLISNPAVATDGNGLEVVAVGSDQQLWVNAQTSPGGSWSGWNPLGRAIANNPALIANQDGRLQAYVIGFYDNAVWTNSQTAPGGSWSGWSSLGGSFSADPVAALNQDGRLQVFGRGTDNSLWTGAQTSAGGGWSGFSSVGGVIPSNPAVTINSDGRLEAFARGFYDNALWHLSQTTPGGNLSGWATLNGVLQPPVGAAQNQDGRVAAFVEGSDGTLWTIEQNAPGLWQ